MARSASKTAEILIELYEENFANESFEAFRITWQDLRGIVGVPKLTPTDLRRIDRELNYSGNVLIRFDNFLVVVQESDLKPLRLVPPRIVEQYLYDERVDSDEDEEEEEEEDDDFIVDELEVGDFDLDDDDLDVDEDENSDCDEKNVLVEDDELTGTKSQS